MMLDDITQFEVGDQLSPLIINKITKKSLNRYARASGDYNPIHLDKDFAQKYGLPNVIVHGMLVMSYLGRMLTNTFPQATIVDFSSQFISMTHINEKLSCAGKIIKKTTDFSGNIIYKIQLKVVSDNNEKRIIGKASIIILEN